ncbi:hypothetical protein MMC12_003450 [Toensbergia leucococca]|nr:hypothetical protein [Toensbergia leucococca]
MRLPRRTAVSSTKLLLASFLLVSHIVAQDLPQLTTSDSTAAASSTEDSTSATAGSTSSATATSKEATTSESISATETSKTAKTSTSASETSSSDSIITVSTSSSSSSGSQPSSAAASTESGSLPSGLPKLPQDNYPAPTVPPTANAPFMQKSNLPEGTVFIGVGAALGFIGLVVLAWRGLVAWSLHRSVRRSANAQSSPSYRHDAKKPMLGNPGAPFYSHGPGSTLSLDQLGAGPKPGTRSRTSTGNLFFSPTAGAGMHTPSNRNSNYLPAGYYAAGSSAPGSSTAGNMSQPNRANNPISLSNLGPQSHHHGYSRPGSRSVGPTPPDSPGISPIRGYDGVYERRAPNAGLMNGSTSSLSLAGPPQGRAPSAYLEDLFENHPPAQEAGREPPRESVREPPREIVRESRRETGRQTERGTGARSSGRSGGRSHGRRKSRG